MSRRDCLREVGQLGSFPGQSCKTAAAAVIHEQGLRVGSHSVEETFVLFQEVLPRTFGVDVEAEARCRQQIDH